MVDSGHAGGPSNQPGTPGTAGLRPWERLSVRLAAFFAAITLLAVGAVGILTYTRQQREVEDTVGTQLLNIARVSALRLDPHLRADARRSADSVALTRLRQFLAAIQDETLLTSPITILSDLEAQRQEARLVVASSGPGRPGDVYPLPPELIEPMGWTLGDGVARYTRVYRHRADSGSPPSHPSSTARDARGLSCT